MGQSESHRQITMNEYEEWKEDYLAESNTRKYLHEKQIREAYNKEVKVWQASKAKREAEEAKRKAEEAKRKAEEIKQKSKGLAEKLASSGFHSMDNQDLLLIATVVDEALRFNVPLSVEEAGLIEAALKDPVTYRFLSLRHSSLATENQKLIAQQQAALLETLGSKLTEISSKASDIKLGTSFAGLAASAHLGEKIAEGFGED